MEKDLQKFIQTCEEKARDQCQDFLSELPGYLEKLVPSLPSELKDLGEKMLQAQPFSHYKELASFFPPLKRFTSPQSQVLTQDRPQSFTKQGVLVLENLRSAANVGNILRAAQFFACEKVILTGYTPDEDHPLVQKTALLRNREFSIEWYFSTQEAIDHLKQVNYFVWGVETAKQANNLFCTTLPAKSAFILGNEKHGLYGETLKGCDGILSLPALGMKNSLNVGHAASICLYAYRKNHQGVTHV